MNASLRYGDRGQQVLDLQRGLVRAGAAIDQDGHFGPATEAAVEAFQRRMGLVVDGIAGHKTRAALAGQACERSLEQRDLEAASERLGVHVAVIQAVNEVESRGAGFLPDGRPVILFERHIMRRRLKAAWDLSGRHDAEAALAELEARWPAVINLVPGGYVGGAAEHQRLALARQIDESCALESASWGLFQVMGFHWERLGYASAQDFAASLSSRESEQLEAFVRFIEADPDLLRALRARRWAAFAKRYNGPDYERNLYDIKLARAFARYSAAHGSLA